MPKNEFICDCDIIHHEIVERVLATMPTGSVLDGLAYFYKILGDTTRCKILYALLQNEMCVCDIANVLSMTKSSVSHQLSKMKSFGVVKCRKEGKTVYYSLDDGHVAEIFSLTLTHIRHKEVHS